MPKYKIYRKRSTTRKSIKSRKSRSPRTKTHKRRRSSTTSSYRTASSSRQSSRPNSKLYAGTSVATLEGKEFETLDNGGTPFVVRIRDGNVYVYKNILITEHRNPRWGEKIGEELVYSITNPLRVFIGSDPPHLYYNKSNSPKHIGNSILINSRNNEYIYIGESVKSFVTNEAIIQYKSPVGNSAVPYPFAIGPTYTYCVIEEKMIPNSSYDIDPYEDGIYARKSGIANLPMKTLVPRTV